MNGAESLAKTAAQAGIEVCFANAGTTEIPLVLALDAEPGMRAILGLFEGVCTGAADGYGRMLDRPALTLLHLGPGFANGIANLHNARKARTPLVNIIGEHATWHRTANAPLAMDIEALAGSVSAWYRTNESPDSLSCELAEAIAAASFGQIATLIVPNDNQWSDYTGSIMTTQFSFDHVDSSAIDEAAGLLRAHRRSGLILGGRALRRRGLQAAARIKAATGCDLFTDHLPPYVERGAGLPDINRIPYFPEASTELLRRYEAVVLVGAREPVTFFGYSGFSSYVLGDDQKKLKIATDRQDAAEVLECLAEALKAPPFSMIPANILARQDRPGVPHGELTPENICLMLAALQPENAVIVDEGLTTASAYYPLSAGLSQHAFLAGSGGSLGYGIPCALGAAVACPERQVINLQADGSAMYTIQAIWTAAREASNVTTLICANKSYNILKMELSRAGISPLGPQVSSLVELDRPDIDWVKIAGGMGVPAAAVKDTEGLAKELRRAIAEPGPHLIEMVVSLPSR